MLMQGAETAFRPGHTEQPVSRDTGHAVFFNTHCSPLARGGRTTGLSGYSPVLPGIHKRARHSSSSGPRGTRLPFRRPRFCVARLGSDHWSMQEGAFGTLDAMRMGSACIAGYSARLAHSRDDEVESIGWRLRMRLIRSDWKSLGCLESGRIIRTTPKTRRTCCL